MPASDSVCSVHTPVALMTCRARTVNRSPVSRSTSSAPVTAPPEVVVSPTTWVRDAACAPYEAAVRIRVETRRASSTFASQYWIAPTAASWRRSGNLRSRPLRVTCWCSGMARLRPLTLARVSYRAMPAPTYARSHTRFSSGYRNGTGLTRCGARSLMSRSRSVRASRTRWKSSICR